MRFLTVLAVLAVMLRGHSGAATYETLHVFSPDPAIHPLGTDYPSSPLLINSAGNVIYGVLKMKNPVAYALTLSTDGKSWTKSTIFEFPVPTNEGGVGCYPIDGLALDRQGNIFGTAEGCFPSNDLGAAYELSPPKKAGADWTNALIFRFGQTANSLRNPLRGSLFVDAAGNLYGGAVNYHQTQTIYELERAPAQTDWIERYVVRVPVDYDQQSNWLFRDSSGAIYGEGFGLTAHVVGDVWKLTRSGNAGGFRYSDLATFPFCASTVCPGGSAPDGSGTGDGLVMDRAGNLYGTAEAGGLYAEGTVFKLTPPAAGKARWKITLLHSFKGPDGIDPQGLTIDAAGNLYGVAPYGGIGWKVNADNSGNGVIYEMSPPATPTGTWKFKILHRPPAKFFAMSLSSGDKALNPHLILGPDNKLYGTANGPVGTGGSVFRVTP